MIIEQAVDEFKNEFDRMATSLYERTGVKVVLAPDVRVSGNVFTALVKGSTEQIFATHEELAYVKFANSLGKEFGNGAYIGKVITDYYGNKVRVVGVKPGTPANWVVVRNIKDKKLYKLPFYEALALLAGREMDQD